MLLINPDLLIASCVLLFCLRANGRGGVIDSGTEAKGKQARQLAFAPYPLPAQSARPFAVLMTALQRATMVNQDPLSF